MLDEAAIRDDGGAEDIALVVDSDTMSRFAYRPPTSAYERALWESTRPIDPDQATIASSAGWIMPQDPDTKPVFVAHSMLAAVWLLRMSLPAACVPPAMWARLAQSAASAGNTSPANNTGTHSREERSPQSPLTGKRRRVASVEKEVEEEEPEETEEQAASDVVSGRHRARKLSTSVSNHNRQAEKRRDAKRLKTTAHRRQDLGLEAPGLDAPAAETAAHQAITPADEPTVAWIIKQPAGPHDFFNATKHPYVTANTMLRCARAVGNDTAKIHAAYFVHNWRRSGHPLVLESHASALVPQAAAAAAASAQAIAQDPFHVEWAAVSFSEAVTATAGVVYRWGMASLGRRYQRKVDALKSAAASTTDAPAHQGNDQKLRNQAKKAIWEEKKPPCSWKAYNARLKRSRRWYQAAETLGWGLLVLIPADIVTPNWVEQTLRAAEWDIWLQLVQRVNPGAVEASRSFDAWLGVQGLEHGSLSGAKTLRIEMAQGSRITEVADSDDDGGDDEDAEDGEHDTGHDVVARSATDVQSPATASLLQSLELRRLFEPHDTQRP